MDPADIGTRFDEPADPSALQSGQPATFFALLKLIALELHVMNDGPGHGGNAGE